MFNLSPKSLEVYDFFISSSNFPPGEVTHEYFQVAKKFIIPELEKEEDLSFGYQFVISLIQHLNLYYAHGVLDDTFLLDDVILNHFDFLNTNHIINLMRSSDRINLSAPSIAKLVEVALSDREKWVNFIRSSDCLVITGNDEYDASLRKRMLSYVTDNNGSVMSSSYKEIAFVHYHNVYKHEDFKKFSLTFEPMLDISLTPGNVMRKIYPPLNRFFKEWAVEYMQDFYYTEVMVNKNKQIKNFKLSLILAYNTTVPEHIRNHVKETLSAYKLTEEMEFLHSLATSGWIDDLENYYSLFLNEDNFSDYYFYAGSEASRKMPHKWILKRFNLPIEETPFVWEGFSLAEHYLFTIKSYKQYHNVQQVKDLKENIIHLLDKEYNLSVEQQSASLDILGSVLESLIVEREIKDGAVSSN